MSLNDEELSENSSDISDGDSEDETKQEQMPFCPRCGDIRLKAPHEKAPGGEGCGCCLLAIPYAIAISSFYDLFGSPECPDCGKVSKREVIKSNGGIPAYLWVSAVLGPVGLIVLLIILLVIAYIYHGPKH